MVKQVRITYKIKIVLFILGFFLIIYLLLIHLGNQSPAKSSQEIPFISSIDTMKVSRDTETYPQTTSQINAEVKASASLNVNYITVDTHWDYPTYMKTWIDSIRSSGKHVWFRIQPNQWEDNNFTTGIMTPTAYITSLKTFILAHPDYFKSGDIFDGSPEPEQGLYWIYTYGPHWSYNAPNAATKAYNQFIVDITQTEKNAFTALKIPNIRVVISVNSYFATHNQVLYKSTINQLGLITFDSYPEQKTVSPSVATAARINEIKQIYSIWHLPIIIGEMGYSNEVNVNDTQQEQVLHSEFAAIEKLTYVRGLNYWVGPGSDKSGGYTHILSFTNGNWVIRPAGDDLIDFFQYEKTNNN
jgi:hypothetical protein